MGQRCVKLGEEASDDDVNDVALHSWRSLRNCRDVTRWLEGAGPVAVTIALSELEAAPVVEAVSAAATFVGIRRELLGVRWGTVTQDPDFFDRHDLRNSLTVHAENEEGLSTGCLDVVAGVAAGRPMDDVVRRLNSAHGMHPVLAMAGLARAIGRLLVAPPQGFSTYNDLYFAELEWMTQRTYSCPSDEPGFCSA